MSVTKEEPPCSADLISIYCPFCGNKLGKKPNIDNDDWIISVEPLAFYQSGLCVPKYIVVQDTCPQCEGSVEIKFLPSQWKHLINSINRIFITKNEVEIK